MTGSTSNSLPAPGSSSTPLYDTKNEMSSTSSSIIPAASSTTNTLTDGFLPSSLSSPPPANRFLMAREGRENQVDTEHDARVVAGTVVINHTNRTILLITSSSLRPNKYVLPKGGVEIDERLDYRITAIRETWEEAGVYAASVKCLGPKLNIPSLSSLPPSSTSFSAAVDNSVSSLSPSLVVDPLKKTGKSGKPEKSKTKHKHHKSHTRVKPELHFYELDVNNAKIADTWPEAHKRTRIWETPEEAIAKLKKSKKPELAEVVKMCSLCRSG